MKKYFRNLIHIILLLLLSCSKDAGMGDTGTGGSMARFAIKGNYLYTVDHENLHTFNISEPASLSHVYEQYLGFGIETIFPTADYLFIGARDGMHIFGLTNPEKPQKLSFTPHFFSYDPVVVNGDYAFVTLRSDDRFINSSNLLLIFDVSNPQNPQLVAEHEMTGPRGLGVDNDTLFICDDVLKVYSITNGYEINLITSFDIQAIDVIPENNWLYIVAEDGLYQYSYAGESISFVSKITLASL